MTEPARLAHLRTYLTMLAGDMSAAGKFASGGEDQIEAAVVAILNGGSAMAQHLWDDLGTVGGQGLAMAQPVVEAFAEQAAAKAAGSAARAAGDFVKDLFGGAARAKPAQRSKEAQRQAGITMMEMAKKMGRK